MTTTERRFLRTSLSTLGYKRTHFTQDSLFNGVYKEVWKLDTNIVTIEWGIKTVKDQNATKN